MSLLGDIYKRIKSATTSSADKAIPIYKFLTFEGNKDAKVDYSLSTASYKYNAPVGRLDAMQRIHVFYTDQGSFDSGGFGNGPILTNGIIVRGQVQGQIVDFTDGVEIKTNGMWNLLAGIDVVHENYGIGDEYISVRFTMSKAGQPIYLDGDLGDYIEVVLNDNFSILNSFYFQVQGKGSIK